MRKTLPQPHWQSTLRNSLTYTPVLPQRREQYNPPASGVTSGKTSEYISSPRVSPIANLNVNHKRDSEDNTTQEMVNAFSGNQKRD